MGENDHSEYGHSHYKADDHHGHGHIHGAVDASITTSNRGLWAVKWSFLGLGLTAAIQIGVVVISGSVALLADTIHNIGDAATALPLAIAFLFGRLKPSQRFPFGYGRVEDIAGVLVVLTILFSAVFAAYEAIDRLLHPREISYLGAVAVASLIGFAGNEAAAIFRLRIGREINSAALIADGQHARVDGWTSLAVLLGATGVWMGYPIADPIIGLVISIVIFGIVWDSGKAVFTRMLDGMEPTVLEEIRHTAAHVPGVREVTEVRARWIGHRLTAEANITLDPELSVRAGHRIANEVNHQLRHHLDYLSSATIHIDPVEEAGEKHHHFYQHSHDGLAVHSH